VSHITGKLQGLVTCMAPMEGPDNDRIVFALIAEVLHYATDGPENELDALHD
jgi:hypothetical protein